MMFHWSSSKIALRFNDDKRIKWKDAIEGYAYGTSKKHTQKRRT